MLAIYYKNIKQSQNKNIINYFTVTINEIILLLKTLGFIILKFLLSPLVVLKKLSDISYRNILYSIRKEEYLPYRKRKLSC